MKVLKAKTKNWKQNTEVKRKFENENIENKLCHQLHRKSETRGPCNGLDASLLQVHLDKPGRLHLKWPLAQNYLPSRRQSLSEGLSNMSGSTERSTRWASRQTAEKLLRPNSSPKTSRRPMPTSCTRFGISRQRAFQRQLPSRENSRNMPYMDKCTRHMKLCSQTRTNMQRT